MGKTITRPPLAAGLSLIPLFSIYSFLGFEFIRVSAPTYDESVHLASGYTYLKTGRYVFNIEGHPPLARAWAAIGLLPENPHVFFQHPDWQQQRLYHYGDYFLYHNKTPADELLNAARRFSFLTWSIVVFLAACVWAFSIGGAPAAIGAAAAAALSPALISNFALVTTDAASTALFFACFFFLARGSSSGGTVHWISAGAAAGLAMAAKYNMAAILPFALGLLALDRGALAPRPRQRPVKEAAIFVAAAFLALAACYSFGELGKYSYGLKEAAKMMDQGRSSFFMGTHSTTGTWAYFPAAVILKTPVAALILAAIGFSTILRAGVPRQAAWLLLPPLAYFAAAMLSKVQIGVRHVLPIFPFLAVWAGAGAFFLWTRPGSQLILGRALLALLFLWNAASVLAARPHLLAYFNELAGGPRNGWRHLTDSNLDWGQDVKELAKIVAGLGNPPIYFSYFGTADPAAYGLRYVPVGFVSNVDRIGTDVDPVSSGRILLAVSATNLQATYFADKTLFDWLKGRAPLAVAGHTIFLYDLTGDPGGRAHLARLLAMVNRPGLARSLASGRP